MQPKSGTEAIVLTGNRASSTSHLAFINGAFLVLGEGSVITALLFEAFFVDETLVDVFDATLINEGCGDLVAISRVVDPSASDPVKQLGKPTTSAVYSPFSLRQIIEFIAFLPLNFIPVAGTPLFLIMTGYRAGQLHHFRYFQLLGLTKKERRNYLARRKLRYTWFGVTALCLQLVPVLSMLFLFTSAAGSALLANIMKTILHKGSSSDRNTFSDFGVADEWTIAKLEIAQGVGKDELCDDESMDDATDHPRDSGVRKQHYHACVILLGTQNTAND
ncbi:MAG: hypothetical protein L6R40_002328 [Gallowayella cf. fulva]|nr:MAG: hypothetical protein L6R40_002328 [Xanthomendoza cf. fulva]